MWGFVKRTGLWVLKRTLGPIAFLGRLLPLVLNLAALVAISRAAEKRAKAKWTSEAVQKLEYATPEDLKLLLGELPPWVKNGEWDRVRTQGLFCPRQTSKIE